MSRKSDLPDRGMDLLGSAEVQDVLGVHGPTLSRWMREGRFPLPARNLASGPVWRGRDVRAFKAKRDAAKAAREARRDADAAAAAA